MLLALGTDFSILSIRPEFVIGEAIIFIIAIIRFSHND